MRKLCTHSDELRVLRACGNNKQHERKGSRTRTHKPRLLRSPCTCGVDLSAWVLPSCSRMPSIRWCNFVSAASSDDFLSACIACHKTLCPDQRKAQDRKGHLSIHPTLSGAGLPLLQLRQATVLAKQGQSNERLESRTVPTPVRAGTGARGVWQVCRVGNEAPTVPQLHNRSTRGTKRHKGAARSHRRLTTHVFNGDLVPLSRVTFKVSVRHERVPVCESYK